jgi:phospholipid/cholesterol/gamma-HCH transport system substrate-binding protein
MRPRASNLVIGTLALVLMIMAAITGLWVHGIRQQVPLRIVFSGSASGLHKGGVVNFDGVQVGEVTSLKLESPRRIVVLTMVDNTAPIRQDTIVGLELQGLTGVAAVSLTGGQATAPKVPLDRDGVPTLTADLSEIQSIRDTLHNVDRFLVSNQATVKQTLRHFETDTAALADNGEAIDRFIDQADLAFEGFDSVVLKIDHLFPGMANGNGGELFERLKSLRELARSFDKSSAVWIEEGRRSLLDISEGALQVGRKFEPQAAVDGNSAPPRKPQENP